MNSILAGTAAAATVVAVAAAGWLAWQHLAPRPAPTAPPAADTTLPAAARVAQVGRALPAQAGALAYRGTAETFARPGQGYMVTYETAAPGMLATRDGNDAARRAGWQARFCSAALQQAMREERVQVVSGRVVDTAGRTQYVADCLPDGQPAPPSGAAGPLL